jgi:sirohydrochlorin ferrochelatase
MKAEQAAFDAKAAGTAAESASARAVSAELEATTVGDALKAHTTKIAKVITAFVDQFNKEISALVQRSGSGSGSRLLVRRLQTRYIWLVTTIVLRTGLLQDDQFGSMNV